MALFYEAHAPGDRALHDAAAPEVLRDVRHAGIESRPQVISGLKSTSKSK